MEEQNNNSENNNKENNRMKRLDKWRKKASKIVDKDGFYVMLFICICIVATTAVWVSRNNVEKYDALKNEDNLELVDEPVLENIITVVEESSEQQGTDIYADSSVDQNNDTSIVKVSEDVQPEATEEEGLESEAQEEQKTKVVAAANISEQNQLLKTMVVPLMGTVSLDYAKDNLVYSKTLEQWSTHNGLDITAKEGSPVRAALDGTIKEIKKDDKLGIVITIDHGEGILTKYAGLSTDEMVQIGNEVKKGDTISGVGKGCGFELAQGPHLHFEVLRDGENINPKDYLPKFDE